MKMTAMDIVQIHDLSAAFDQLVQAGRVRGHGTRPLAIAAVAFSAQLAIECGYDDQTIRAMERKLIAGLEGTS